MQAEVKLLFNRTERDVINGRRVSSGRKSGHAAMTETVEKKSS